MHKEKNTEVKRAICFGCWLQAGVIATIEDGRATGLKGEPGHPVNQGWICERSKAFVEHLYHEDRLNFPLKRIGERGAGEWQKISWPDALDEVAEKLDHIKDRSGAEAVASIGGTGRGFSELFKVRFMNLFGSPNHANAGQWCSVVSRQIHAAIYGACNPLVAYPNTKRIYRALKSSRLELFIVAEQWMTPSAMLADYVFPITNWLEHPQLYTQTFQGSGNAAAIGERIVAPLYERRTDFEFYRGLGLRLGQEDYWRKSLEKEWDWCLEPLLKELNLETLQEFARKQRWWSSPVVEKRYATIDPATGQLKGFATPTAKVELYSTILEKLGYDPLPYYEEPPETSISQPELAQKYPFTLITGARFRPMHHSEHRQIRSLRKLHPHPIVEINPETARQQGIGDGEWVVIETPRGKIKQKAKLTSRIAPRTVESQHGWWFPEEISDDPTLFGVFQSNVNVLTPDSEEFCDPATGAVTFGPLLCKIYPLKKYV